MRRSVTTAAVVTAALLAGCVSTQQSQPRSFNARPCYVVEWPLRNFNERSLECGLGVPRDPRFHVVEEIP